MFGRTEDLYKISQVPSERQLYSVIKLQNTLGVLSAK